MKTSILMRWLATFVGFGALVYVLYGRSLNGWWAFDDSQILKHALDYSPRQYFWVPEAWRALIPYSLTPWLSLDYDLDQALFGFQPAGFYFHNLLSITLCVFFLYELCRPIVGAYWALMAGIIFLVGTPVVIATQQLMVRHYMEGLTFFLLGCLLFRRAVKRRDWIYPLLSATAFGVSFTAKEVFVPLSLVTLMWPLGSWKRRIGVATPLVLLLFAYVFWRRFMLGDAIGGYVPAGELASRVGLVVGTRFGEIPRFLWAWPSLGFASAVLAAVSGFWCSRNRMAWMRFWWVYFFMGLLPLVPLVLDGSFSEGSERFLGLIWLGCTLLTVSGAKALHREYGNRGAIVGLLLVVSTGFPAGVQSYRVQDRLQSQKAEYEAQGQWFLDATGKEALWVSSGILAHYLPGLDDLRKPMGLSGPGPTLLLDEADLAEAKANGQAIYRYEPVSHRIEDMTSDVPRILSAWRLGLKDDLLQIDVSYRSNNQELHWNMGPYREGSYVYLTRSGRTAIPAVGALRRDKPLTDCFRVRYLDNSGATIYSPWLSMPKVDAEGNARLVWEGNGERFDQVGASAKPCASSSP